MSTLLWIAALVIGLIAVARMRISFAVPISNESGA